MSALARKWRPRTFAELVGQDAATQALCNALSLQRLHHAYLFTGTRGVGKTSIARLFAKSLNCEEGISATPCLKCEQCIAIEAGRSIDVIEIDGASNTKVEDTRDLLNNVPYLPTSARYKIYLIDEVHMLSSHSFNALLKTLEEPPSHVIFLLATTEQQKLPVTILSRCLQFHLKHLTEAHIVSQLIFILQQEHIAFEEAALKLIARAAKGSMRDALSLLDQIIITSPTHVTESTTKDALGYSQQDFASLLLLAFAENDTEKLIALSRKINDEGAHYHYVADELLSAIHQLQLMKFIPQSPLITLSNDIQTIEAKFDNELLQLMYEIGIKGRDEMTLAPSIVIGFEMMLLRMLAFKPSTPTKIAQPEKSTPIFVSSNPPGLTVQSSPDNSFVAPKDNPVNKSSGQSPEHTSTDWATIISKLNVTGVARNALENTNLIKQDNHMFILSVSKGHSTLFTPTATQRIEQTLSQHFNTPCKITLTIQDNVQHTPALQKKMAQTVNLQEAHESLIQDAMVQALQTQFSAEIVTSSIVSAKDVV